MTDAQRQEIREARRKGELLGDLEARYGAAAVVEALGVMHIACSLGLRDEVDGDEEDFEVEP